MTGEKNAKEADQRPVGSCPICGVLLSSCEMEANEHVNLCLDALQTAPAQKSSESAMGMQSNSQVKQTSLLNFFHGANISSILGQSLVKQKSLVAGQRDSDTLCSNTVKRPPASLFPREAIKKQMSSLSSNPSMASAVDTTDTSASTKSSVSSLSDLASEKRQCPKHKWIPGTDITMDAFSFGAIAGCSSYFLSHFHADHYGGLASKFAHGTIWCSWVTGNLVIARLKVDERRIIRLPFGVKTQVDDNVAVVLYEANHCPGSAIFVFKVKDKSSGFVRSYLHTGDFRADADWIACLPPELTSTHFDSVFLDTTYCDPRLTRGDADRQSRLRPLRRLVVVGTYLIGKERLVLALAKALDCKIYVTNGKKSIVRCMEWDELYEKLTDDPASTPLHVSSMNMLNAEGLSGYLDQFKDTYDHIVAIRPTGWTFPKANASPAGPSKSVAAKPVEPSSWTPSITMVEYTSADRNGRPLKKSKDSIIMYGVPYSEHSSYAELQSFLKAVEFERVVPTVNNRADRVLELCEFGWSVDALLAYWADRSSGQTGR